MRFAIAAAALSVLGVVSFASAAIRTDFVTANTPTIANAPKIDPANHNLAEVLPYTAGGFESFSAGALAGQSNFTVDLTPDKYLVTAAGGVGGTKGVQVTGGGLTANWAYPTTTAYTPSATELISVNADIARSVGATSAASSFGYMIDVYSPSARTFRFGLGLNSSNLPAVVVTSKWSSALGFSPAAPTANVLITASLVANTFYNLEARANYVTKTFDLYSNNALILGNMPFADLTATSFSDADLQVSTNTTLADGGNFDNYAVNVLSIPEPTTLSALAGLALVATRRRSR